MKDFKLKLSFRRGEGMKRMLLFVLLMLSVGWVFAETITVGTGTGYTTGAPIDFKKASGWSRSIYLENDLKQNDVKVITGGAEISGIEYIIDSNYDGFANVLFSIYLKQTEENFYTGSEDIPVPNPISQGYSLLKTGQIVAMFGGHDISYTVNNNYVWDGQGGTNLEVLWVFSHQHFANSTTPSFQSTTDSQNPNRTSYLWVGETMEINNIVPNLIITFTPAPPPPPPAVITKSSPAINEAIFTNSVTFKWEIGEGVPPSSYTLYYEKGNALSNPPENTVNIPDGNATEHTVVGLEYDKSYVWKLVPYKDGVSYAGSDQEWVFTTESILCSNMNEDFDTFPPTGWR